jgi:glycosidase
MNFKDKVVYQIYPKSFQDTNGDGWGDIPGITRRLDYLAELGVDYLWLTPFFPSPQRDNGYDVADYRAVDPRFGTMADLEALIAAADKKNIGLMFDMVFNHTSTEHAWFQKALAGTPCSGATTTSRALSHALVIRENTGVSRQRCSRPRFISCAARRISIRGRKSA